jgi:anti-anti-sigma regulatory factor
MSADFDNETNAAARALRLRLPPTVDSFDLATLLHPLLSQDRYCVCLDAGRVARLGTVEFRVLSTFAASFKARGGFLKLENVGAQLGQLVREFGLAHLLTLAPDQTPDNRSPKPAAGS